MSWKATFERRDSVSYEFCLSGETRWQCVFCNSVLGSTTAIYHANSTKYPSKLIHEHAYAIESQVSCINYRFESLSCPWGQALLWTYPECNLEYNIVKLQRCEYRAWIEAGKKVLTNSRHGGGAWASMVTTDLLHTVHCQCIVCEGSCVSYLKAWKAVGRTNLNSSCFLLSYASKGTKWWLVLFLLGLMSC